MKCLIPIVQSGATKSTTHNSFIGIAEVKRMTSLSKSTILRRMEAGEFPRSIPLGQNTKRWVKSEVDAWVQNLIKERDGR